MTFRVHFYAEQAFLAHTKAILEVRDFTKETENSAMCILACASAIEAFSNNLLSKLIKFRHFDELKIISKIEQILLFGETEPNWGSEPWQSVKRLIRMRNWLAHFKEQDIGLVNSSFEWLGDASNAVPTIDPLTELTFDRACKYYDQSRKALLLLVTSAGADVSSFAYLTTEKYEPFLIG